MQNFQPIMIAISGSLALCNMCSRFRITAVRFEGLLLAQRSRITGSRFARFLLKSLLLKRNLCKAGDGRQSAQRLAHIAREAGARWAKGAKRILPIGLALGEEAEFEAINCLRSLNLIRSTTCPALAGKLHLRTEPAFLPNAC